MGVQDVLAKIGIALGSFWTTIVSGAAAIGAALVLGSEDWKDGIPWDQAIPFLGAASVWLGSEFTRWNNARGPSPHDLKLSRRLRTAFDENTRRFLKEHSFGLVYHESKTAKIERLNWDWQGVDHEFEDAKLKAAGDEVTRKLDAFLERLASEIGVADRYPATSYSVPSDRERANDMFEEHTNKAIGELNGMAADLLKSYEAFERIFRSRAPIEFA